MSFLIAVLARGLVVSLLGLLLLWLFRRGAAATRHALCVVTLGALLALPIGIVFAPKQEIEVRNPTLQPITRIAPIAPPRPGIAESVPQSNQPKESGPNPIVVTPFLIWVLGAAAVGLRLAAGYGRVLGWVYRSRPLNAGSFEGPYQVRVSPDIQIPVTLWAGRSIILLPEEHVAWSEERRTAVLLHEAAHIQRADCGLLVISRLALALHWPNPFAWMIARVARQSAEDAADDIVLGTGLAPADYADHLLAIAQRAAPFHSALAIPMAQRPDVHRRIHHVLNQKRSRGSASLATLIVASSLIGGVFVPAVCLVTREIQSAAQIQPAPAIQENEGKRKPGNEANKFVGTMSDGRQIEMLQLALRTKNGDLYWRPNGDPIPPSERIPVRLLGAEDNERTILVRFKNLTSSPEGGLGSGPNNKDDSRVTMIFDASGSRPSSKKGFWESWSFIGVPAEKGIKSSFTFGLNDEPWAKEVELTGAATTLDEAGRLRNIQIDYPMIAKPFRYDANGKVPKDAKGEYVHDNIRSTSVAFVIPAPNAQRMPRVIATLKNGKKVEPIWNDGGYKGSDFHHRWFIPNSPSEISKITIETRGAVYADFLGVHMMPDR